MNAMVLHCHVKRAVDAHAAVHMAQELVHPSKWQSNGVGNGLDELQARRAMRERQGIFGAFQRRGHWRVEFTPSNLQ